MIKKFLNVILFRHQCDGILHIKGKGKVYCVRRKYHFGKHKTYAGVEFK